MTHRRESYTQIGDGVNRVESTEARPAPFQAHPRRRMPVMTSKHGPWWSNTWWGKRTATVNVSIAVALLLFMLWKALFR